MNERAKITAVHLSRQAIVYLRQSSAAQVEHNRESTERQYALAGKARELGWPEDRILVIDEDLGLSGSGSVARSGFSRLTAEVALARVGLVLGLEVSRLARNNADWHRLIDLAGLTDTLIGDADGIYHPALFNDRLLLGLKGTMSEAELHVLRARLNGGIRNKAVRGELRRGLPVGFVWGEADGEVLLHPDETVVTAIRTIFARFAETGSARRVWLWFRDQGLQLPLQMSAHAEIRWVEASYHAIHQVLSNPVYAGAYVYGKTRTEITLEPSGSRRKRIKHLPRDQWQVLIKEHHRGYIDWQTYEANQQRIARNTRPGCATSRKGAPIRMRMAPGLLTREGLARLRAGGPGGAFSPGGTARSGVRSGQAQHLILRHEKDQRLPGRHITDCQMRLYMKCRQNHSGDAAAKAGFSTATGDGSKATAAAVAEEEAARTPPPRPAAGVWTARSCRC